RPVHVAVAHQDELRVDALRTEGFGEGFVELWHGRVPFGGGPPRAPLPPLQQLGSGTSRCGFGARYIRPARRRKGASSVSWPARVAAPDRCIAPFAAPNPGGARRLFATSRPANVADQRNTARQCISNSSTAAAVRTASTVGSKPGRIVAFFSQLIF